MPSCKAYVVNIKPLITLSLTQRMRRQNNFLVQIFENLHLWKWLSLAFGLSRVVHGGKPALYSLKPNAKGKTDETSCDKLCGYEIVSGVKNYAGDGMYPLCYYLPCWLILTIAWRGRVGWSISQYSELWPMEFVWEF